MAQYEKAKIEAMDDVPGQIKISDANISTSTWCNLCKLFLCNYFNVILHFNFKKSQGLSRT